MKEVILTLGQSALVDDELYWKLQLWSWYAKPSGAGLLYACTSLPRKSRCGRGRTVRMHRFIMGLDMEKDCPYALGCCYKDECCLENYKLWDVHHLNEDTMDNRRENLEVMPLDIHRKLANGGSIFKPAPLRPTTKFIGVRWNLEAGKWQASWKSGSGEYVVGLFNDDVSAAIAYDYAARKLLGRPVKVNFPADNGDVPF